jgi:hypothetical protein
MPPDCRETRHGATLLERDEISFNRHARPCVGHPRLYSNQAKDVDGRNKSDHAEPFGLIRSKRR